LPGKRDPEERRELLAGRYRVDGLLGRGGMSEVYEGYDERLDRSVAIKVLRPPAIVHVPSDSPEAVDILDALDRDRKRFLREVRVTARLEHPGTPAVYDTGVETFPDGGSRLWVVMQLLRGSTLEALLKQADYSSPSAAPSVAWAAAIAAQIAAVLTEVHRVDVVHRDIKPSNVMITDGGLVKVLDFGIAILRGAGALPRLSQVDGTAGTPAYMSPEQWLGQVVSAASDVYSLGCVLFELLTGEVPFVETSNMSLSSQHLSRVAPIARARRADVPAELDALVFAMLAKDPSARPTATEVYAALLPLTTKGPRPDRSGSGAAGKARAMAAAAQTSADHQDPTRPFRWPLLAPATSRLAPLGPHHSLGKLTDAEAALLLDNAGALLDADRPSAAIGLLDDGVERAVPDPALQLRLRHMLGAALFYAGEYTRAASVLDAAGRDYRRYFAPNDPHVLDCAYHAGYAYAEIGQPGKALPQLRFYVLHNSARAPEQASAGSAMASVQASEWAPVSTLDLAEEDEARKILETRFAIAQLLATDGRTDEALAELQAVRPLLSEVFGLDSTQVRNLDKQAARLTTPQ
jgi:serine/threonine protein kinase